MSNDSKLITVYIPKNKAEQVVEWFDPSPLTDETLKELGFRKDTTYNDWIKSIGEIDIIAENGVARISHERYDLGLHYLTTGSVRMLIEALKGNES